MREVLRSFRPKLKPYRGRLLLGGLLILLVTALELAMPWPLKIVVDDVLGDGTPATWLAPVLDPLADSPVTILVLCSLAMVVLAALAAFGTYVSSRLLQSVGERLIADLRTDVFTHLQRLSLRFHDRSRVGDLSTRLTGDVTAIQALLVATFSTVLPNLALLVGILVVAVVIQPVFALVLVLVAPAMYGVVRHYRGAIKQASREARTQEGRVASHVTETLSTIRLLQSFAGEGRSLDRFDERSRARLAAGLRQVDLQSRLPAAIEALSQASRAVVLFIGAYLVLTDQLSLGILLVLLAYLQQMFGPMKALARLTSTISKAQAGAERVEEVLRSTDVVHESPEAVPAGPLRGDIELRGVSFGYQSGQNVLSQISMSMPAGQTIALAGPTGAGKSTIASLIPRLYDVTRGQVLLDGRDVRELTLASVRRQIAVVSQEALMITGSIMDNIAYAAPESTEEQLLAAARAAYVDEFVDRLPDGYDTHVSEGGVSLSGGQRQRISIARALAADAPIVLLDEPTSGLDAISESLVMQGLSKLTAGRTLVVIAHRLSTLRDADNVYVIDGGRVVDSGTHAELIARPGPYHDMHEQLVSTNATSSATGSSPDEASAPSPAQPPGRDRLY